MLSTGLSLVLEAAVHAFLRVETATYRTDISVQRADAFYRIFWAIFLGCSCRKIVHRDIYQIECITDHLFIIQLLLLCWSIPRVISD